jgi:hypothetical protein
LKGKIDNFEEALFHLYENEYKSSFMLKKKRIRGGDIQTKRFIGKIILIQVSITLWNTSTARDLKTSTKA